MTSRLFFDALRFSAEKHRRQRRHDRESTPYINHPINVCTTLRLDAQVDDEIVLIAALLHDTIEDTDTTFEEIEFRFGAEVCSIVREVTDDKTLEKKERKRLQIVNAADCSPGAKLIKLADKLDNLKDLEKELPYGWTEDRRIEYFMWAKKVVECLRGTNINLEKQLDDIFQRCSVL